MAHLRVAPTRPRCNLARQAGKVSLWFARSDRQCDAGLTRNRLAWTNLRLTFPNPQVRPCPDSPGTNSGGTLIAMPGGYSRSL